jgi:hypothetical protein
MEHRGDNPQLRNKSGARALHQALEEIQTANRDTIYQALVHICRLGKIHAANEQKATVTTEANLANVLDFIDEFLPETDGGCSVERQL